MIRTMYFDKIKQSRYVCIIFSLLFWFDFKWTGQAGHNFIILLADTIFRKSKYSAIVSGCACEFETQGDRNY